MGRSTINFDPDFSFEDRCRVLISQIIERLLLPEYLAVFYPGCWILGALTLIFISVLFKMARTYGRFFEFFIFLLT
jgi:hypothetical protein